MNYNGIVYNEAVLLAFTNKCMGMLHTKSAFKKCNLQCFPATKNMRNERHRALEYARLKSKVTNKYMGMLRKKSAFKKCNLQCFTATKGKL